MGVNLYEILFFLHETELTYYNHSWQPGPRGLSTFFYLLHRSVSAGQLLSQVSNVMVVLLHVLLEVISEHEEGFLHLTMELRNNVENQHEYTGNKTNYIIMCYI